MIIKLAEQANANLTLLNRGRRLTIDILVGVGADDFLVSIEKGRVVDVLAGSHAVALDDLAAIVVGGDAELRAAHSLREVEGGREVL